jgi:hypothetical protein
MTHHRAEHVLAVVPESTEILYPIHYHENGQKYKCNASEGVSWIGTISDCSILRLAIVCGMLTRACNGQVRSLVSAWAEAVAAEISTSPPLFKKLNGRDEID